MLKIYINGINWTDKVLGLPDVVRRLETDGIGEAGVIVMDEVQLEIPLNETTGEFDETMRGTVYKIKIEADFDGVLYPIFNGVLDWKTVEWTQAYTVRFTAFDALLRLQDLAVAPLREEVLLAGWLPTQPILVEEFSGRLVFYFFTGAYNFVPATLFLDGRIIELGSQRFVVDGVQAVIVQGGGSPLTEIHINTTPAPSTGYSFNPSASDLFRVYDIPVNGIDVYYYVPFAPPFPIDAIKVIQALVRLIEPLGVVVNATLTSLVLPREEAIELMERPRGLNPFEYIKKIVASLGCVLFVDGAGQYVLKPLPAIFSTAPTAVATFGKGDILMGSWRKKAERKSRIDKVEVSLTLTNGTDEYHEIELRPNPKETLKVEAVEGVYHTALALATDLVAAYGASRSQFSFESALEEGWMDIKLGDQIKVWDFAADYQTEALRQVFVERIAISGKDLKMSFEVVATS